MNRRNRLIASRLALLLAAPALATTALAAATQSEVYKIGQVTWHAKRFVDHDLVVSGYLLKRESGYVIVSDEARGGISVHDLPVSGPGADQMQMTKRYVMKGKFLDHGLSASNGSPYHLELAAPPEEAKP
jgi:hypothetical protein